MMMKKYVVEAKSDAVLDYQEPLNRVGERKMQAVGLEPTRANTLRPERSTLDHSVTLALVFPSSVL